MSDVSPYLARQFSGSLAQNTINTVQAQYVLSDPIIDYWYGLSIDTASDADLISIGYLVGLPWPSAPGGTFSDASFTFGTSVTYPIEDPNKGFSGIGLTTGGQLSSALSSSNNLIPSSFYRVMLKAYAFAKWYGLSFDTIDAIASVFSLEYSYIFRGSISFELGTSATYPITDLSHGLSGIGLTSGGRLTSVDPSVFPDSDITILYDPGIGNGYIWILQQIFSSICTEPQVFVFNA